MVALALKDERGLKQQDPRQRLPTAVVLALKGGGGLKHVDRYGDRNHAEQHVPLSETEA